MSDQSFKKLEGQLEKDLPNAFSFMKQLVKSVLNEGPEVNNEQECRLSKSLKEEQKNKTLIICATCQGRKILGNPGHEIPCPTCSDCKTCGGKGKLGAENHLIDCPVCCK